MAEDYANRCKHVHMERRNGILQIRFHMVARCSGDPSHTKSLGRVLPTSAVIRIIGSSS